MKWKTTLALLIVTIGLGTFISLYEIRQPSTQERQRLSRELLSIPPESVSQIELQSPNATISLARDGTRWRLGPQRARANGEVITQLLNETASLIAQRILSESPGKPLDLKALGLDPAVARLTLTADGTATTLLLGETTPVGNNRYAKVADRPQVAVIASALFETINQPAEEFRDPLLIRVDTWITDSITITAPHRLLTVARSGMDWQLTQPVNDRADRTAVMNLLSSLSGLRIARIVDEAPQVEQLATWGFDAPQAEVTLSLREEPASLTVFFGKPMPEDRSLLYAKRSDEPALYAVSAPAVDALLQDPNDLRANACVEFFTSEVTKIEVLQGTSGWTIERKGDTWQPGSGTVPDPKLSGEAVEGFLNTLADLRLSGFVDEHPQDLTRYGLEPPSGAISVWTMHQDAPQRLLVGTTVESSTNRYGRVEGREAVVSLPETVTALLQTPLEQFSPPNAENERESDGGRGGRAGQP